MPKNDDKWLGQFNICSECFGSGKVGHAPRRTCPKCKGTGKAKK